MNFSHHREDRWRAVSAISMPKLLLRMITRTLCWVILILIDYAAAVGLVSSRWMDGAENGNRIMNSVVTTLKDR